METSTILLYDVTDASGLMLSRTSFDSIQSATDDSDHENVSPC